MSTATVINKLTPGQKKAGLSLNHTRVNTFDAVMKVRIFYANIFDAIYQDVTDASNEEQKRLAEISINENVSAMRTTIRALTFAHD